MTWPPSPLTSPAGPAGDTQPPPATSIRIREGSSPWGRDLSFPRAISQLQCGDPVTVVPVTAGTGPGGDPRGEPVFGFDIAVYPARKTRSASEPLKVNWGSKGAVPAADAALFATALTLAAQLAQCADLTGTAPAAPDQAAAMTRPAPADLTSLDLVGRAGRVQVRTEPGSDCTHISGLPSDSRPGGPVTFDIWLSAAAPQTVTAAILAAAEAWLAGPATP